MSDRLSLLDRLERTDGTGLDYLTDVWTALPDLLAVARAATDKARCIVCFAPNYSTLERWEHSPGCPLGRLTGSEETSE
jgi:hypothetical protein